MATGKLYSTGLKRILSGDILMQTHEIRVTLHSQDASVGALYQTQHEFLSSVLGEVANGNGYATAGDTIANGTITLSAANSTTVKVDIDDAQWTSATISARYGVVSKYVGAASTGNPLIAYVDFGSSQTSSNGTFTVAWSTAGMFTINVA